MNNYEKERDSIDEIDREILSLLAKRSSVVNGIGNKKLNEGTNLKNSDREKILLKAIGDKAEKLGLSPYHVKKIYREIIGYSLDQQHTIARTDCELSAMNIAYLGIDGANTHSAALRLYGSSRKTVKLTGHKTIKSVFKAVANKEADCGVVPIENTTAGSINEVYDLLYHNRLWISGEEILPIKHCLLASEQVALDDIRTIISHPQALTQCSRFIDKLAGCMVEVSSDTATAVKTVSERTDKHCAAIGSEEAATAYDMKIIRNNLSNQRENYTRFIVISNEPAPYNKGMSYKTSLLLSTQHKAGSLENCLRILSGNGINMTKLESRPRPNMPWEYMFYIDIEGSCEEPNIKEAIDTIREHTSYLKILGSYPVSHSRNDSHAPLQKSVDCETKLQKSVNSKACDKKLVEMGTRTSRTVVSVGRSVKIGSGFTVIAGPCAVESREQITGTASAVSEAGAHILRGGVYKPRTSPYSFQGLGEEGLRYLMEASAKTCMPTVSEVMNTAQVERLVNSVDMLQVGARNMQNFPLLSELGKIDKPVLLKRGMMASIEELLMAAEYIIANGNSQIVLCERGIRTFETATRNTLDLSAVVVLKERTHLPVIVDPSHATGVSRWIRPLAKAALVCGADGIMVEVHNNKESALCDGSQSLTPEEFGKLMEELGAMTNRSGANHATCTGEKRRADLFWQPVGW